MTTAADLDTIEYAIRYCIGRNTYAFNDGLNLAETNWAQLSNATRHDVIAAVNIRPLGLGGDNLDRWPTIRDAANTHTDNTT